MPKETIETLEKKVGLRITVMQRVPNKPYTGVLLDYDTQHLIFEEEDGRRLYIPKNNIVFPN